MSSILERSRSETFPAWVLFPLRAFLGFTFVFAGLQKVSDRQFFTAGAPGSIQLQLQASLRTSPVHFLVNLALHAPVAFGLVIALAEIGIGLGVALGLFGRVAAAGGMLLSLLFFLTVSFNTWPYYYGSDIAFFFAWTPLVLAGSGPLSADAALQSRSRRKFGAPPDAVLHGELGRRALLGQLGAAGVVGVAGLFVAGVTAAIGRAANRGSSSARGGLIPLGGGTTGSTGTSGSTPGSTTATSGGSNPGGTAIGKASDVPVGGAASFTDPATGQPAFVVQPTAGNFVAFSAICTHARMHGRVPTGVASSNSCARAMARFTTPPQDRSSKARPSSRSRRSTSPRARIGESVRGRLNHIGPCGSTCLGRPRGTVTPREDTGGRFRPGQQLVSPPCLRAVDGERFRLVPLMRRRAVLQLGASLGTTGSIPPDRATAAVAASKRLRHSLDAFGVEVVVALGTAALREATNGPEVVRRLERAIGFAIRVLDGDEEARLCLVGQKASVWTSPGPVVGLDLGGGSLEVAMSDGEGLDFATSLPVGAARLRAALGSADPMTEDQREQAWDRTCESSSRWLMHRRSGVGGRPAGPFSAGVRRGRWRGLPRHVGRGEAHADGGPTVNQVELPREPA